MDNKSLYETIRASEAHRDETAIKTVIDGKRGLGWITLKGATVDRETFFKIVHKYNLKLIHVPSNPYQAIIYYRDGFESDAKELHDIAEKYNGYLAYNATLSDSRRIGQLLGYDEKDIDEYIDKVKSRYPDIPINELLREALLRELKQKSYSYGCIMLYFKVDSSWWKKIQNLIDDEDIDRVNGVNGREKYKDAHVTILYGLHKTIDEDELKKVVEELSVKQIEVKKIGRFKGDTNDVLKFEVDYSFLHKNNKILKKFPHTSTFPTYKPHMTIAYLKKGRADDYVQTLPTNLQKILKPSHFVYSKANGKEVRIDFKK